MKNNTKLQGMKQNYETIPLPKNLEERVNQGIAQAKSEVQQQKIFYKKPVFWAKFSGCVAAAMAALTLLTNFNAPIAHAMENIPVLHSIVKIVSFRTFENTEKDMSAKVTVPQIEIEDASGQKNDKATKALNDNVKQYTNKIIQQYKADVKATDGEGKEAVLSDYKVITNNSRLFSLKIETTITSGSSDTVVKIYHIDKLTGKSVTLKDIFQKDTNYLSILTKEIKRQMREQMAKDEQISYSIDDTDIPEDNWQGLTNDADFYMNNNGELTFLFDKYEVAPGYMGSPAFTIPTDVVKDIIRSEYLPA